MTLMGVECDKRLGAARALEVITLMTEQCFVVLRASCLQTELAWAARVDASPLLLQASRHSIQLYL